MHFALKMFTDDVQFSFALCLFLSVWRSFRLFVTVFICVELCTNKFSGEKKVEWKLLNKLQSHIHFGSWRAATFNLVHNNFGFVAPKAKLSALLTVQTTASSLTPSKFVNKTSIYICRTLFFLVHSFSFLFMVFSSYEDTFFSFIFYEFLKAWESVKTFHKSTFALSMPLTIYVIKTSTCNEKKRNEECARTKWTTTMMKTTTTTQQ